ncbi:MAG: valine--tRNA ligase [Candidatus Diapherotrites archaeon]|nr:valine--tRNA ligase [Candidatus Diapherotrites archaeon]
MPKYNPLEVEKKWQDKWLADGTYKFDIDAPGEVYAIDNPPSFTSGTLHMGHVLNHAWIDFMARYKRMRGYNVLFPLGYDCHGLPTELKVAKEFGISPGDRKKFREACEDWTTKAITQMNEQYKRIGYSCDWDEYYETRMPKYKALVQKSLLDFHKMGRVYREKHPVLWCTKCRTALAKAEVGHVEEQGKLWHLKFPLADGSGDVTFGTTRPELSVACNSFFVHEDDERYKSLVGKKVKLPYVDREVEVLSDRNVDREFGTGVLYVCTFGDEMDIKRTKEHKLTVYEAIDDTGRMTEVAGKYAGMKVREAQAAIVEDFKKDGYLVKIEELPHSMLCHTERTSCKNPIEFLPKHQFFIKVTDKLRDIVEAAESMQWFPGYMEGRLVDWTKSLDWDWIISRQRVYGTPIPFWHCEKCDKLYAPNEKDLPIDTAVDSPPQEKCECGGALKGTSDVCDCWVDSSVTPLAVSKWLWDPKYFEKAYPNYLRPQGYEIIRTWAFYTMFRCLLLTGQKPFKHVVVNGMVAGPDGRKMAKSYGNVVAPEPVLDNQGADAIRQWALMASLGEDYPFSDKEIIHGLKFQKKFWNASYFASQFLEGEPKKPSTLRPSDKWILHKLNTLIKESTEALDNYEFYKALGSIRSFFWHDFCDYYLEIAKDRLYNATGDDKLAAQYAVYKVLMNSTLMLAPFVPHITEEVHELYLKKFTNGGSVHLMAWPEADESLIDLSLDAVGEGLTEIISAVRKFKTENQLALNSELSKVTVYKPELSILADDVREAVKAREVAFAEGTGPIEARGFTLEVAK